MIFSLYFVFWKDNYVISTPLFCQMCEYFFSHSIWSHYTLVIWVGCKLFFIGKYLKNIICNDWNALIAYARDFHNFLSFLVNVKLTVIKHLIPANYVCNILLKWFKWFKWLFGNWCSWGYWKCLPKQKCWYILCRNRFWVVLVILSPTSWNYDVFFLNRYLF